MYLYTGQNTEISGAEKKIIQLFGLPNPMFGLPNDVHTWYS